MELNLKKINKDDFISEISFAQSYQMQRQTYIQENTGVSEKFSDFVGNKNSIKSIKISSTFSRSKKILIKKCV